MALTLSSRDVARFAALQEALLSPLEYPSVEDWCVEVLRRAEALFCADRSAMMLVPLDGSHFRYVSESIEPQYQAAFQQSIAGLEPGAIRFSDTFVDRAWAFRRAKGLEVWSIPMLSRLAGIPMDGVPMVEEVVRPAGLMYGQTVTVPLPAGEAFLGVSTFRPAKARFEEKEGLKVMAMLAPAFKAGVRTLVHLDEQRRTLMREVDALGRGLLMYDVTGREIHRSRRLEELLATEPDRERVVDETRRLAGSLARIRTCRVDASEILSAPAANQELQTRTARYCVRASLVGCGIFGLEDAVLVWLERLTPVLPSHEDLIQRHGLTSREAEVALLLAQGLSNREIADRFSLSTHTVRHHAESVFAKLGIHSRKALGLKLLGE